MPNFQEGNSYQQENITDLENKLQTLGKLYKNLPNIKEIAEGQIGFYFSGSSLYCFVKINNKLYRVQFMEV